MYYLNHLLMIYYTLIDAISLTLLREMVLKLPQ